MYTCEFCNKAFDRALSLSKHRCAAQSAHYIDVYNQNRDNILEKINAGLTMVETANSVGLTNVWLDRHMRKVGDYDRPKHFYSSTRKEKAKQTWMEKYGVSNPSKLSHVKEKVKKTVQNRYGVSNATHSIIAKIKHYILGSQPDPFKDADYDSYKATVNRLTAINKQQIGEPVYCYYSGVLFNTGKDHFNNAIYPTIDHKISIWYGFENDIPPEQIADANNLVWCAKLLNTYKRHMTEEQFRVTGIIERFVKYESEIRNSR